MTWSGSAFLGGVLSDARDYRFPGAQRGWGFGGGKVFVNVGLCLQYARPLSNISEWIPSN